MPIIIISNQFDPDKPVDQSQTAVTLPPNNPPEPKPAPAPQKSAPIPQAAPKPVASPKAEVDPDLSAEFYNRLNEMVNNYKISTDDYEKGNWVKSIYKFPIMNGPMAGGTIGGWLTGRYLADNKKKDREDAKSEVMSQIWSCLEAMQPGGNIIGCLKKSVDTQSRKEIGRERAVGSQNLNEHISLLAPYFSTLQNPDSPTGKRIDEDILQRVENGTLAAPDAAWEQYKRDYWKDTPDPQTGATRIAKAVEAFGQMVEKSFFPNQRAELQSALERHIANVEANPPKNKAQNAKYEKMLKSILNQYGKNLEVTNLYPIEIKPTPIDNKKEFLNLKKDLAKAGVDTSIFDDPKSPYWLNGDMIESRVTPEMLKHMWDTFGSSNISMDASPEGETGEQLPSFAEQISEKEWRRNKDMELPQDSEAHKTLIQDAPIKYLQDFQDPAQRDKIEKRLPLIQPASNPNFFNAIRRITDNLYGGAYAPPATDEQGMLDERTKDVLYRIGQFYANTLKDDRPEESRLRELEQSLTKELSQPIALKHYNGPPLKPQQQFGFALREVMLDMMDYLGNDVNYQQLVKQLSPKAVAELKTKIRTAGLSFISALILRG